MIDSVTLPYGSTPQRVSLAALRAAGVCTTIAEPPRAAPQPLEPLLERALDEPIDAPRLDRVVKPGQRVVIALSDATRAEPRDAMLRALLGRLPADISLVLAIATGTHGPADLGELGVGDDLWRRGRVLNHDGHEPRDLVSLGTTPRGTPMRVHRAVVDADWILATGRIKPHYFAGFSGGIKAIFPGLGENDAIRTNHRLKRESGASAGVIDDNPCRLDMEDIESMLPGRCYLLNVVMNEYNSCTAAVAGDVQRAFRHGAALCQPLFRVKAPAADVVLVSDALPLTGSLYQASKLIAAVVDLVKPGGTIILAAECPGGIGPVDVVNRGIYQLGIAPRLPREHRVILVSGMTREQVAASFCEWAPSVEAALADCRPATLTILPRAGSLLIDLT